MFPVNRLAVDPERFTEASKEPMSPVGMGVTYTKGSLRQLLREQPIQEKRQALLERYSIPHRQKLTEVVEESPLANDHCLIIDGHNFPALLLPYELNQTAFRSDFCIGTDDFHTSEESVATVEKIFLSYGYSTARNQLFS